MYELVAAYAGHSDSRPEWLPIEDKRELASIRQRGAVVDRFGGSPVMSSRGAGWAVA